MSGESNYLNALAKDKEAAERYYLAYVDRPSEQQKFLENLIAQGPAPAAVLDCACGSGAASVHLHKRYPSASFTCCDLNPDAVALAQRVTLPIDARCEIQNLLRLRYDDNSFDLVLCLQTLFVLEPEQVPNVLKELIRVCRPAGRVYATSLFNLEHDVDVYATYRDRTRPSGEANIRVSYNTFSSAAVSEWFEGLPVQWKLTPFTIGIDLPQAHRGIGTYTESLIDGRRLQISGGMMMNWAVLEISKSAS